MYHYQDPDAAEFFFIVFLSACRVLNHPPIHTPTPKIKTKHHGLGVSWHRCPTTDTYDYSELCHCRCQRVGVCVVSSVCVCAS